MENVNIVRAMATGIVEHGFIEVDIEGKSIIFDVHQYSNGNTVILLDRSSSESKDVLDLINRNGIELEKDGETVKSDDFISYATEMYSKSGSNDGCWEVNGYNDLDLEDI